MDASIPSELPIDLRSIINPRTIPHANIERAYNSYMEAASEESVGRSPALPHESWLCPIEVASQTIVPGEGNLKA